MYTNRCYQSFQRTGDTNSLSIDANVRCSGSPLLRFDRTEGSCWCASQDSIILLSYAVFTSRQRKLVPRVTRLCCASTSQVVETA